MELAIPTLPCRSLILTLGFYGRLGFGVRASMGGTDAYAILERGTLELHFFEMPWLDPDESYAGCYIRVDDLDALHEDFSRILQLPDFGIPRLSPIEQKPWGMREFHLVDPDGNLLRVGAPA